MPLWLIYALLSAVTAALVAIFGKIGLQNIDANSATAIRSVIMALFCWESWGSGQILRTR